MNWNFASACVNGILVLKKMLSPGFREYTHDSLTEPLTVCIFNEPRYWNCRFMEIVMWIQHLVYIYLMKIIDQKSSYFSSHFPGMDGRPHARIYWALFNIKTVFLCILKNSFFVAFQSSGSVNAQRYGRCTAGYLLEPIHIKLPFFSAALREI